MSEKKKILIIIVVTLLIGAGVGALAWVNSDTGTSGFKNGAHAGGGGGGGGGGAKAIPQPVNTPDPQPDCNPNYDPCIPNSSTDLDCADVGQEVTVTGTDEYGLDGDGDGYGCEAY